MTDHRWPDEEQTQRIVPKRSRYQRALQFLQGASVIGAVAGGLRAPHGGQTAITNAMGIGQVSDDMRDPDEESRPNR